MNPEFADLFCLPGDRRNDVVVGDPSQETTPVYEYDPVTGEVTTTPHMYEGKQVVFTKHITLIREDGDLDVGQTVRNRVTVPLSSIRTRTTTMYMNVIRTMIFQFSVMQISF